MILQFYNIQYGHAVCELVTGDIFCCRCCHSVALLLYLVQIRAVVDETFGFEQVPQAFDKLERGHARGKTVIDVGKDRTDS